MNWRKVLIVTIILGLLFQVAASLFASNHYVGTLKKPFHLRGCRVSSCPAYNPNNKLVEGLSYEEWTKRYPCQPSIYCDDYLSFGYPPIWSEKTPISPGGGGFSPAAITINLFWFLLAFLIALPFSKNKKSQ